jgi:DNA mismatch repair protein MutS2
MKIFPETSLLTAEFEKIKELISFHCIGALGKRKLNDSKVFSDIDSIHLLLGKTNEFKQLISASEIFPTDHYKDISKELNLLKIENSVLLPDQFINILKVTITVRDVFRFFETNAVKYPQIFSILENVRFEKNIITDIENVFDEEGVVRSTASAELARIRRTLQRSRVEADRVYQAVINKYRKEGWLTESEQSSRNGRRVISVFAEQKRALKGIVHDVSTTGKTVFLEPGEVIEINNSIFNLEQEERLEIQRILRELTSSLRKYYPLLSQYMEVLSEFDYTRAKALFAISSDAHLPHIINKPCIELKNAKHPLLYVYNKENKKQTIPFDLRLNEQRILVISGPNAGGKTVCMKTIGLLQMMLQSGMLVTADENSTMGIFEHLLVDIGDSQSLEYELSTYSSRLTHAKVFLERSNEKSLFLIDEFGTGTDPNLGGALAESILVELNKKKSFGIITTHYLNLKVMADKTPGIINGSMAFDAKNLKPLYRLMIGKPGSSYTFVVAERSGLPQSVIQRAKSKVDNKSLVLEKLLNDVEKEKSILKKKLDDVFEKEKKLNEFITRTQQLAAEAERMSDQVDERLRQKELKLISQSEETIRKFLKEYKLSKNKKQVLNSYLHKFSNRKKELEPGVTDSQIEEEIKKRIESIKIGSLVKLTKGRTTGKVEQIINGKAHVLFGAMKTICDLRSLVPVEENNATNSKQ